MLFLQQRKKQPDAILIATGSEVRLAVEAQKALLAEGIDASVVSMPCNGSLRKTISRI